MKSMAYVSFLLAFILFGCQTAPVPSAPVQGPPTPAPTTPAPIEAPQPVPDPSAITPSDTGFSPRAQAPADRLALGLHFGHPSQVTRWSVAFVTAAGDSEIIFSGEAPELPPRLEWDGTDSKGMPVADGTYRARLTVNHGATEGPEVVESPPFVVDQTPPGGTISATPDPFEPGDPNELLEGPRVTFHIDLLPGGAPIATWRLGVFHPDGRRFADFISEDHRDNSVSWNGRALNNALLERGITYRLEVEVRDRYGNVGLVQGSLAVAPPLPPSSPPPVPVTLTIDGRLIASTQIYFPPFSSDFSAVQGDLKALNQRAIADLADHLRPVLDARIRIVGHANQVFWNDRIRGDLEQREVLIPLSEARAQAVEDALVAQGLPGSQFEVAGLGAIGAVAPFGDSRNNWKNRRVEFIINP